MKRVLFAFFLLFPAFAMAQPALVRSGEHQEFSRLVVYVPEGTKWVLDQDEAGASLKIPDWEAGFDVSTVFNRIPRTRISEISADTTSVEVAFGCRCEASAEVLPNGPIVIDILDRSEEEAEQSQRFRLPTVFEKPEAEIASPLVRAERQTTSTPPDVDQFRSVLLKQIGQAASQSILNIGVDSYRTEDTPIPGDELTIKDGAVSEELKSSDLEQVSQIRTRSATDYAQAIPPVLSAAPERRSCVSSEKLAFEKWSDGSDFMAQLGKLRSEIYGEFDEVNLANAVRFVRLFLHFGLTDEARLAVNTFASEDGESTVLLELADLIDGKAATRGVFSNQFHCDGAVRFWSVLASPEKDLEDGVAKSLISTYASLPLDIRKAIGPRLIRRFSQLGFETEAGILESDLSRSDPKNVALVALESGRAGKDLSEKELVALVAANDQSSPAALAVLIDQKINSGARVENEIVELAQALSDELGDTAIAIELQIGLVRAAARNGKISQAFDLLANANGDGTQTQELTNFILSEALGSDQPAQIALVAAEIISRDLIALVAEGYVQQLTQQLVFAGLPEMAKEFIGLRTDLDPNPTVEALLALHSRQAENILELVGNRDVSPTLRTELALRTEQVPALVADPELSEAIRNRANWETRNYSDYSSDDIRGRVIRDLEISTNGNSEGITLGEAAIVSESALRAAENIAALLAE